MSDDLIERLRHCISDLTTTQKRAKQAERALAEAVEHYEWGRENQRLTDADNDKEYEAMRSRAEQAERALAEAVKVVESLLLSLSNNSSERVKAARQFVKEHSANAGQ